MKRIFLTLAALALAFAGAAQAQTNERVAAYKDWSVFNPASPKECYIVSPPVATTAERGGSTVSVSRSEIRLFVTIRPDAGVNKEVSYTGGYPFKEGSTVDVSIGTSSHVFNIGSGESDEWAWPSTPEKDAAVIQAMKRGTNAVVTAVSSRGTTTRDTFSLLGFTAALAEAERLCQ